jgi:hypothetical protein
MARHGLSLRIEEGKLILNCVPKLLIGEGIWSFMGNAARGACACGGAMSSLVILVAYRWGLQN